MRSSCQGLPLQAGEALGILGKWSRYADYIHDGMEADGTSSASDTDASGSDNEDEDEDESDDPTGAKAFIAQSRKDASDRLRAERKAKKHADIAEALRLADERRQKQVNLNGVTSISKPRSNGNAQHMTCYKCGQEGHMKNECPQRGRQPVDRRNRER